MLIASRRINYITLLLTTLVLSAAPSLAQKPAPQKFNDAIKRSGAAAEIITIVAQLSQNSIPKELIDHAAAIGVFPCKKTDLLVEHAVLCPGVIISHTHTGWSLPAFYRFVGAGLGRPDPALGKSNAMIMLFMTKQPVNWLSKATILRDVKEADAGPLGSLTQEQRSELANDRVLAYARRKDTFSGEMLRSGFWKGVGLVEDNHINQSLYGMKGDEVLAGKKIDPASLPLGISAFQKALEKYWPTR